MAKRKTADTFKDTSFEVGYNSEPKVEEPIVSEKEPAVATEPVEEKLPEPVKVEEPVEKKAQEAPEMVKKRNTVIISTLHKEMIRIYCYKKNILITDAYHEILDKFFENADDIRQEALENIRKGLV